VADALVENDTLAQNGANQAVTARIALLVSLLTALRHFLNDEITVEEAATLTGYIQRPSVGRSATETFPTAEPKHAATTECAAATWPRLPALDPSRMISEPMPKTSPNRNGAGNAETVDEVYRRTW